MKIQDFLFPFYIWVQDFINLTCGFLLFSRERERFDHGFSIHFDKEFVTENWKLGCYIFVHYILVVLKPDGIDDYYSFDF